MLPPCSTPPVSRPDGAEPLLAGEALAFHLPDGRPLFSELTLALHPGVTAVTGPNGSGKSILLRILAGHLPPTRGRVHGSVEPAFLPQRPDRLPGGRLVDLLGVGPLWDALARLDGGEGEEADLLLVGNGWDLPSRIERLLQGAGLPGWHPEHPVERMSGGEATRVALAGLRLAERPVVLLDEPTNHLDGGARAAVAAWLDGASEAVLVVTHDRALLRLAHRILELGAGPRPRMVEGGLEIWKEDRARRREGEARALDRATRARSAARTKAREAGERQDRRLARGARKAARGGAPKVLLGARKARAEGTRGRVEARGEAATARAEATVRQATAACTAPPELRFRPAPSGLEGWEEIAFFEGLGVQFEGPGVQSGFGPLEAHWIGPVRVAVAGPNGSGKSTLLRILAGDRAPDRGTIRWGLPRHRIAHLDQWLPTGGDASVLDRFRALHPDLPEHRAREVLDALRFPASTLHRPMGGMSEGERVRLALATALGGASPPGLLLLDEPTNHLDLEMTEGVEALLRAWDGALVVVSHDEAFLEALEPTHRIDLPGPDEVRVRTKGRGRWSGT